MDIVLGDFLEDFEVAISLVESVEGTVAVAGYVSRRQSRKGAISFQDAIEGRYSHYLHDENQVGRKGISERRGKNRNR